MRNLRKSILQNKLEHIYFSHYGVDWKFLFDVACKQLKRKIKYNDVQDLAQECVIDTYKEINKNGLKGSIKALLHTIAHCKIVETYRNKKNYVEIKGENKLRIIPLDTINLLTDKTPENFYEQEETKAKLNYVFNLLSPRNRDVLKMMHEGYKDKEIAEVLDIKRSSVRSARLRAIEQIKIKFNENQIYSYS